MSDVNPKNARTVRRYLVYLREAEGLSPSTIDYAARAIAEYEKFTKCQDFGTFNNRKAAEHKRHLLSKAGKHPSQLSERSTVLAKLRLLQSFFRWLAQETGYRSRIKLSDIRFLSLPLRDVRIANDRPAKAAPTVEQVQHVLRCMPCTTDAEKRDRALIACLLLTGARVSALISLKLKHVRADGHGIDQDAREVKTKFGKTFPTFFFPIGPDARSIFIEYVRFLREDLLWSGDDPLFPRTRVTVGTEHQFSWGGLDRAHWQTPDPVRKICKRAFAAANLPYYSPHTFRTTITRLGEAICRSPEKMKAWSQNLGHEDVQVTLKAYGRVSVQRQAELITGDRQHSNEYVAAASLTRGAQLLDDPEVAGALRLLASRMK